ncbi:DUF7694 domain-containing protein [Leptospira levettii]|uniref:DUF7694 domain-containing protein n=1 Tax=Leptospira levettii TaxID=2023178 RepID=UPI000C29735C|nr:hypothetical protein [Leptospira levettii]PJZ89517.1 hypothetical protein CH368_06045 [Leptospira levettii]
MAFKVPNEFRVREGQFASDHLTHGNHGLFVIPIGQLQSKRILRFTVISSDGEGWEHVSVSIIGEKRTPTWEEMCAIKNLFWDEEDAVIQFHPPKSEYVNCHPYVLHLWKPIGMEIPRPPTDLVGVL